jgi:hypothetical protein
MQVLTFPAASLSLRYQLRFFAICLIRESWAEMESLADAFKFFEIDAARLEVLPAFNMPVEQAAFTAFKEGLSPDMSFLEDWRTSIRTAVAAGKTHRRLRVFSQPLTDYEKFEIVAGYPDSIAAGENIRYLARQELPAFARDIWIFDHGAAAFEVLYSSDGSFVDRVKLGEGEAAQFSSWFEEKWAAAQVKSPE